MNRRTLLCCATPLLLWLSPASHAGTTTGGAPWVQPSLTLDKEGQVVEPTEATDFERLVIDILMGQGEYAAHTREQAATALARHGTSAAPVFFKVMGGRVLLLENQEDIPQEQEDSIVAPRWAPDELIHEAVANWKPKDLERAVRDSITEESVQAERMFAARLLAQVSKADGVPVLVNIYSGVEAGRSGMSPFVSSPYRAALMQIMERDKRSLRKIKSAVKFMSMPVMMATAPVLSDYGGHEAMRILEDLLDYEDEVDVEVIKALGCMHAEDVGELRDWAFSLTRPFLDNNEPELRRVSAITLGALCDETSTRDLILLLEDENPRVVGGALRGLQALSRLVWTAESGRWRSWFEQEQAWYEKKFNRLAGQLNAPDRASALQSMREISAHPLYRRHAVREIGEVALGNDMELAKAAINYLTRLDDPEAFPFFEILSASHNEDLATIAQNYLENKGWTVSE